VSTAKVEEVLPKVQMLYPDSTLVAGGVPGNFSKLYTPPPFLVDFWSIPSIPVHSQESLGSPGLLVHSHPIPSSFLVHSQNRGGVDMRKGDKGGESV
jgi:hypothetical protein